MSVVVPKKGLNFRLLCPDCQNAVPNLVEDYASGDVICRDCGSVLMARVIDTHSEWRTFASEPTGAGDDPSRVGGAVDPLFLEMNGEMTLDSTIISSADGGTGLGKDLQRVQTRATSRPSDRNLVEAFKSISTKCERIGLPKLITDRAKQFYKTSEDLKTSKGKALEGMVAACIYLACRIERVPRTFREISALTRISKKDIGRCYKLLVPLVVPKTGGQQALSNIDPSIETVSPSSTHEFLARFCSYLNLNLEVQKAATTLCHRASKLESVAGKSPISIAAACIYMISQLYPQYRKQQKDIAFVAGVSEVTIRNTYKDLYAKRYELITSEMAPVSLVDSLPTI